MSRGTMHCAPTAQKATTERWLLLTLSLLVFGVTLFVGQIVLQDFPNSADEYAFLYQGELLSHGVLYAEPHSQQVFLSPFYLLNHEERLFSIYPPGWPLLLAVGHWINAPGLINPLLTALTVPVIFLLALRLLNRRSAWLAVGMFACSPFVILNGGSYFSHPACLLAVLLCVYSLVRSTESTRWSFSIMAGLCFSWAFMIREMSSVLLLVAPLLLTFLLIWNKQGLRSIIRFCGLFAIATLPLLFCYLWYNRVLTGEWFLPMRKLLPGEYWGFGPREVRLFDYVEQQYFGPLDGLRNTAYNLKLLLLWSFAGVPLFALASLGLLKRDLLVKEHCVKALWILSLIASFVGIVLVYFAYHSYGDNQYGPRYYYEAYGFLLMVATYVIVRTLGRIPRNYQWILIFGLMSVSLIQTVRYAQFHQAQIYQRRTLYRLVEMRHLTNAVVFVSSASGDMTHGDLIRNPIDPRDADVLYAWHLGARNTELMQTLPDRDFYLFGYTHTGYFLKPYQP